MSRPVHATLVLAAILSTGAYAQKPVVLISGNGNLSIDSKDFGAGVNRTTVSKHDQTMEMAQDFLKFCSGAEITLEQAATSDYFVLLNRKGSPTLLGEIGQSQIMVLNRKKSVLFVAKTGTVKNSVRHACNAIAADWQAHGRIESPANVPEVPVTPMPEKKSEASNSPPTIAVLVQPTAAAEKRCKPETISAVLSDTTAYLTAKGLSLGTVANSGTVLVLIVDRPFTKWIAITIQQRDHAGNVLWSEKVSDTAGGGVHLGTTGLLNTLERVHKIIDAKMPPEGRTSPAPNVPDKRTP